MNSADQHALSPDVLCFGIVVADLICKPTPFLPYAGGLSLTEEITLTVGGCSSNVAVDLAKLNQSVGIVGRVGNDLFGEYLRTDFKNVGVDCKYLETSTHLQTATTFVINVQHEDRRFIHVVGANGEFTGEINSPDMLDGTKIVYVGGFLLLDQMTPDRIAHLFRSAHASGATTILDVVLTSDASVSLDSLREVLCETDYFFPNNDEAEILTGLKDPLAQAVRIHQIGARQVIVTCGSHGCVVVNDVEQFQVEAFPVSVVDGTGSGDAFTAGFILGLLESQNLKTCIHYGSALGASCVQVTGSTTGLFNNEELKSYVEDHQLVTRTL